VLALLSRGFDITTFVWDLADTARRTSASLTYMGGTGVKCISRMSQSSLLYSSQTRPHHVSVHSAQHALFYHRGERHATVIKVNKKYFSTVFSELLSERQSSKFPRATLYRQDLMNSLCRKIATETDRPKVKELNALLRAIILDEVEEVKFRLAFLGRTYGITFGVTDYS
jgi:hypothetical protein